jgi:pyruvate,water dikinase
MVTKEWSRYLRDDNNFSFILPPEECSGARIRLVGGKAASLGELTKANIPVPPFIVISSEAYREYVKHNGLENAIELLDDTEDESRLLNLAGKIRSEILKAPYPTGLKRELMEAYGKLVSRWGVIAVRSSATLEDAADASFAGQYETFLGIRSFDQLLDSVKRCYASLFNDRSVLYRKRLKKKNSEAYMAVVVQSLVRARSAGVMFTLNPTNGDPSVVVIESSWGLGEAVVKGEVIPDSYVVSKVTGEVLKVRKSGNKPIKYETTEDGELLTIMNPPEAHELSLSSDEAVYLAEMGVRLENHYGRPQDVEWVVDKNLRFPDNLFVVQSRPATVSPTTSRASELSSIPVLDRMVRILKAKP